MNNSWLLWISVITVCAIVEVVTVELYFAMFCIGAVASLALCIFGIDLIPDVIVFALVSLGSVFLIRPMLTPYLHLRRNNYDIGISRHIGEEVILLEKTSDKTGKVSLNGEAWSAYLPPESSSWRRGQKLIVTHVNGAYLEVSAKETPYPTNNVQD